MISSRVLSRLLPVTEGDVSTFEGLHRDSRQAVDLESQTGQQHEELFRDGDENPEELLFDGTSAQDAIVSPQSLPSSLPSPVVGRSRLGISNQRRPGHSEDDEDVPDSLLLEPRQKSGPKSSQANSRPTTSTRDPKLQTKKVEAQWRAAQEQHGLHASSLRPSSRARASGTAATSFPHTSNQPNLQAEAMWLYTNANNLDAFLQEVYQYYVDHGVWSILLRRALNLLTEIFVFSFAMFLSTCIDYSKIPTSKKTSEVYISKCMSKASWIKDVALFFFVLYALWRVRQYIGSVPRLLRIHNFYQHVLGIDNQDIQTVSWVRVVDGLVKLQNANVATAVQPPKVREWLKYGRSQQRMNAESIANRLMRQANFYVAMYNKDILDFTLPIPLLSNRPFYSKSLEWCIDFCLTNFIFDEQGSIRPFCLDVKNRRNLVNTLRIRLQFAALTSVLVAPFNILRFCILYFFRYYTEFTRNPSKASARSFTPFAEWKIRQFNELDHLFQRRLNQAHPFADDYLKQFPKDKTDQICRFVGFVSGAIASVLAIASLLDPELFLGFEVTPGRTAFFWFTFMIGIFTFAHGMLPDENEVHDPILHLKEVLMFTHYMPAHWKDRLHSNEVRAEFSAMYQPRILIFLEEVLSLILAPWILLRNALNRSERLVDFFREHTVHVDGIGYQCNFAVFGFKKNLNVEDPTTVMNEPDGLRDDYFGLKDDKMAASVHNFMQYYSHYNNRQGSRRVPGWQPPPAWPPITSPTIQEAVELTADEGNQQVGRSTYGKASSITGMRHQRFASAGRSPRLAAHEARFDINKTQAFSDKRGAKAAILNDGQRVSQVSRSRLMVHDSDLNEYSGVLPREPLESDTDAEEGVSNAPEDNAGVLGMLYQFSKGQTEKRAGVNI